MAFTKVQIVSNALGLLGQKPIIALQNQSDIITAAEQAFDFLYPSILSTGQWRFAAHIVQLSQLVIQPVVSDWNFIYELPADYLKMIRQYPHNYAFEIFENRHLYSNLDNPLFIEYIRQPVIGLVPEYFWWYFIYEIASMLALSNAQYASFAQFIEQKLPMMRGIAMANDAQNRPNTPMVSQPVITNRAVSTFVNG